MTEKSNPNENVRQRKLSGVLAQIGARRQAGQSVDLQAMIRAFPELEVELRAYFAAELGQEHSGDAFASTRLQMPDVSGSGLELGSGSSSRSETTSEFSARMFGRYRLLRPVGEGAMGSVFLAHDTTLDRQVALKIPKKTDGDSTDFFARFAREARAAAGLNHPSICRVYDAGEVDGTAFITMDFINGVPLSNWIGTPELKSVEEVLRIAKIIAAAIAHAHASGVIHRDLKPGNILVDEQRNAFVTDFGLARRIVPGEGTRVTQEGLLIGTPAYMAPEQVRGEQDKVGVASDIYSFGVVLFEMLVGRLPFDGKLPELLAKVLRDPAPIPSRLRSDLTEDVDDLVLKMLQKDPNHRFRSMSDVIAGIERLESHWNKPKPTTSEPSVRSSVAGTSTGTVAASSYDVLKSHIEAMLKKGQYATAIQDLEQLAAETAPLAKNAAAWAKKKLPAVKAEAKAMSPAALAALLQTAQDLFNRHDYAGAIQLLSDVPALRRNAAMEDLLSKAQDRESEAEMLLEDIRDRERREMVDGLEPVVKKFLKLKPGSAYAKKLLQALQTYSKTPAGRRKYRFERGRLQPMPAVSFFRQWAVLAVLTFVLVFLGSYSYVVNILNSNHHVMRVEIDREWLREQGGELTVFIDDVEHPVKLPLSDADSFDAINTTRGDHLIGIKKGDTFVYGPDEFVIEQKDPSTLQVTSTEMRLIGGRSMVPKVELTDNGTGGSSDANSSPPDATAAKEQAASDGWVDLFDGKTASGWKSLGPFQIHDGLLVAKDGRGVASTEASYGDFEFEAEWKLEGSEADGGIYYRQPVPTVLSGHEYQLIAPKHPGIKAPIHRTASFWGVVPPNKDVQRPLGEWNRTKIVRKGTVGEHWLNDELVVQYDTSSQAWKSSLEKSVLADNSLIKSAPSEGLILLQSFSDTLAFRSIRVRSSKVADATATPLKTQTSIVLPDGMQKHEANQFSLIHNATPEEVVSWGKAMPLSQCPIWMSVRANSHEPRFDCVSSTMGANKPRRLAIVDEEMGTFNQPELKGGLPVSIASFREGNKRRSIGLTVEMSLFWEFWVGDQGFVKWKAAEGLKHSSPFDGQDWPAIPIFFSSNHVNAPGSYYEILQPHVPYREPEIRVTLSKTALVQTLKEAREKNRRPFRFGFDHVTLGRPTFLVVLVENVAIEPRGVTQDWSYSLDLSADELKRHLELLTKDDGVPRSLFSYIWNNELRYCVIWDNVSPEELAAVAPTTAEVEQAQDQSPPSPQVDATLAIAPFDAAAAQGYQTAWSTKLGLDSKMKDQFGIDLVLIPPGEFTMGSPDDEPSRDVCEGPQHTVRISQPFYLGATEVSQQQWFDVMGTRPWAGQPNVAEGNDYPACYVNWFDAQEFCKRLSEASRSRYRLPTEAEWEYAGRAGTTKMFYFWDSFFRDKDRSPHVWSSSNTVKQGKYHAQPVGTLKPNPFGLFDIHGNLWEWCEDQFLPDIYSKRSGVTADPVVATSDPNIPRITRGAGFDATGLEIRIARRGVANADFKSHRDGFRVVRVIEETK